MTILQLFQHGNNQKNYNTKYYFSVDTTFNIAYHLPLEMASMFGLRAFVTLPVADWHFPTRQQSKNNNTNYYFSVDTTFNIAYHLPVEMASIFGLRAFITLPVADWYFPTR